MTKICMISDTHGLHDQFEIPECDILIHAGDFTNVGELKDVVSFFEWLRKQPAKQIVFIAGNHDISLDYDMGDQYDNVTRQLFWNKHYNIMDLIDDLPDNIHYLNQETVIINDLNIYGSPYTPTFGRGWAFNVDRGIPLRRVWEDIPHNTDILVTHGPPYGMMDKVDTKFWMNSDENVGDKDLLAAIKERPNIKLVVCGHIHDNNGYRSIGNTVITNACLLNNQYTKQYKPLVIII